VKSLRILKIKKAQKSDGKRRLEQPKKRVRGKVKERDYQGKQRKLGSGQRVSDNEKGILQGF